MKELNLKACQEISGGNPLMMFFQSFAAGVVVFLGKSASESLNSVLRGDKDKEMNDCFHPCVISAEQLGAETEYAATTCYDNCSIRLGTSYSW